MGSYENIRLVVTRLKLVHGITSDGVLKWTAEEFDSYQVCAQSSPQTENPDNCEDTSEGETQVVSGDLIQEPRDAHSGQEQTTARSEVPGLGSDEGASELKPADKS